MKKSLAQITSLVISLIVSAIYWYVTLPAFNLADFYFLGGVVLFAFVYYVALVLLTEDTDSVKSIPNIIVISLISIWAVGAIVLSIFSTPLFQAKNYSNLIQVENKEFNTDFQNTDVNKLALLDKDSAVKIGNSLMGTIDKESQFEISKEYRQITIKDEPYRVSPLGYASFIRWLNNRKDGIQYYIKINQTTGKGELVKLEKGMKYTASSYFTDDVSVKLRLSYPTTMFGDPSFEVDDEGNPYYVATTYSRKFILGPLEPNGVILLNAVTGETQEYSLSDVPEWVDRVYSATNVIQRVNQHYAYKNGFWNSIFSKEGVRQTTDEYNYITIGSDIYLYTGLTSVNADNSNLGFVLVNMRTRETSFYRLPSVTETSAMKSAEGAVQEKGYNSTAPILTKLNGQAYYLVSLKDKGSLIKAYALVNAEDFQKVTVNTNINELIKSVTGEEINNIDEAVTGEKAKQKEKVNGTVTSIKTQVVDGTTIYYLKINDKIYKIQANKNTLDKLPFLEVNQTITAETDEDNFLLNITFE